MSRPCIVAILLVLAATCLGPPTVFPQAPSTPSNPYVDQLKSHDPKLRAEAARELGKSGDPAVVPALAAAVKDPSEKVRREVVVALATLRAPECFDPMIAATRDEDPQVRVVAIEGLTGYYTGQIPSPGFTGFVQKTWQRAKSRFVEENVRIDPGITVEPKVISALIEVMNDTGTMESARKAANGLGVLLAQAAVPELVKAAHSSDEDLAVEALKALAKIKDNSAGPPLVDLLEATNKGVKKEAAVTVGVLRTTEALPRLQSMYENNPDKSTREKALEGLAYLGSPVSVPLFINALWNSEQAIRTLAAEGLAHAGDAKTMPELEKAVHAEKDGEAKLAMEYAITALGKTDYLSAIVEELGSKFRGNSAQTYLVVLARDPSFLPRLYPFMASQDATVRRRLCTVLMFTGDQTSVEHLERLSHDRNGDVAKEALRALRAIRTRLPAPATGAATGGQR